MHNYHWALNYASKANLKLSVPASVIYDYFFHLDLHTFKNIHVYVRIQQCIEHFCTYI